jgi:hypothetical protein
VLFDANGAQAFGALGGKDKDAAFSGHPSLAEQEAMAQAVKWPGGEGVEPLLFVGEG